MCDYMCSVSLGPLPESLPLNKSLSYYDNQSMLANNGISVTEKCIDYTVDAFQAYHLYSSVFVHNTPQVFHFYVLLGTLALFPGLT